MTTKNEIEKNGSSFDLLWEQVYQHMDACVERSEYRDELLLESTKKFAENVKRNQQNLKQLTDQFIQDIQDWERTSREEILTATSGLQYIFSVKSYEEINSQIDQLQKQTSAITALPFKNLQNEELADAYVKTVEQYIAFRRKNRNQYVENLMKTVSIFHENQKSLLNAVNNQVKNALFPFQQYLYNSSKNTGNSEE